MAAIAEPIDSSETALPVCLDNGNPNRLVSLWWAMQHSGDLSRQAVVVTCYLDESGTHDYAPIAIVGGLLLNKSRFLGIDPEWTEMLKAHAIPPPLHMKDFRRPEGRLANVSNATRHALFTDAIQLINKYKIYSMAAELTADQYKRYFDKKFIRKGMGVYGACFIVCARMNQLMAEQNDYRERIAFLMDSGNQYANHVQAAHNQMQKHGDFTNVGSLTFDDDKLINPLQAADVIAWASRVKAEGGSFDKGYEPLSGLFDAAHAQETFPEEAMVDLAARIEGHRQGGNFPL